MRRFRLTQSNGDTAYLKFPNEKEESDILIDKSVRVNSLINEQLNFDIVVHIGNNRVVGIEVLGD